MYYESYKHSNYEKYLDFAILNLEDEMIRRCISSDVKIRGIYTGDFDVSNEIIVRQWGLNCGCF